jgi:hypothetical protein
LVWAGTDDGLIHLTRDDGAHWNDVTPAGLGAWSKIGIIEASHFDPGEAYAAVDRHRLDDDTPLIYRTRDFGKTWQRAALGIPYGSFVNAVREDPERRGLLYAGTETGVFVSFDDGEFWQPLQFDLPACSVRDLSVRDGDLIIATHGRSFWVLDDLAPLRQASAADAGKAAFLYVPPAAYRLRPGDDEGTPLPPETPQGENPAQGAPLDFVLGARPRTPVVLTVADAAGRLVRRYASDDAIKPVDPATLDIPAFWVVPAKPVPVSLGMHRFMWDLRDGAGTWVPPGRYSVRLSAGENASTQTLEVRRDPRGAASDDDLRAQYALATEVYALRARVSARFDAASARKAAERELAPLRAARVALGEIYDALESGDAAPTPAERSAFASASATALELLARGDGAAR